MKCAKCGCNLISTPENPPPPGTICKYCRIQELEAQLATESEHRLECQKIIFELRQELAKREGEVQELEARLSAIGKPMLQAGGQP